MAYDLAVIGGGPGGLATAMYAGMRGLSAIAFEAQSVGGQLINLYPTKPVVNFPAQAELPSRELAQRLADQAVHFNAELAENEPVELVVQDDGHFRLVTPQREVEASSLVLALGLGRFRPRKLGLEDEDRYEGRGLTYRLPALDQIDAKRIVIVGGGDSAVDTALSLQKVAHVTLVHHRDALSAWYTSVRQLEESDVELITNGEVVGVNGSECVESVVVSIADEGIIEVPADVLFVSIGQLPDLAGTEDWGLGIGGDSIDVNAAMETSRPGLFAVGDFAHYGGKVKMIATAVAEGSTAANSAQRYLWSL